MAVERETPYGAFNYLVDLGTGDTESVKAGFQEVSGLGTEVTIAEYRAGNDKANHTRKYAGVYKSGDVTLKRGLIGATDLWEWIKSTREGSQEAKRSVTIQLQDEAHSQSVVTWKLTGAQPIKWTGPALNAKGGSDVAMEELVLSVENVELT